MGIIITAVPNGTAAIHTQSRYLWPINRRTCVSNIKVNIISICNLCNSLVFMVMSNFIKLFYEIRTSSYLSFIMRRTIPHTALVSIQSTNEWDNARVIVSLASCWRNSTKNLPNNAMNWATLKCIGNSARVSTDHCFLPHERLKGPNDPSPPPWCISRVSIDGQSVSQSVSHSPTRKGIYRQ